MGCTVSLISVFHFTFHVEPRSQTAYLIRIVALQTNAHRDSLLYLHEIARGIVLRNQGESRSRGIGNRFHYPSVDHARNRIGREGDFRPLPDVRKLGFPVIGDDPKVAVVHDVHHRLSGLYQLALMDILTSRHPVAGGNDDRIGQVQPGQVYTAACARRMAASFCPSLRICSSLDSEVECFIRNICS